MKKYFTILAASIILVNSNSIRSQDTFSICAVDPATGQVGSAGASCVNDCTILTDVHPGHGVVHTQAYWLPANQNYARTLMNLGLHPLAIIDSLVLHDAQNNPTIRQYGIVDLVDDGRVAAYTGVNCNDYKNHITGPTYSIQGNILLGQQILDSMRSRFLNTPGTLAAKLMAAMQGANVIGADTRCTGWNTSSLSAFIKVANPGDTNGVLHLDLEVLNAPFGREPIDSLQILYNNWLTSVTTISVNIPEKFILHQNFPNPFNPVTNITFEMPFANHVTLKVYDILGSEIAVLVDQRLGAGTYEVKWNALNYPSGIYYYHIVMEPDKLNLNSPGNKTNISETKKMLLIK